MPNNTVLTKYPVRVGQTLYPKGTTVKLATFSEMKQIWPGILAKPDSRQVGVWFPGFEVPTIVGRDQLVQASF